MSTAKRIFLDNNYYHVYNRGNHKEPIFHAPRDYERFLFTLRDEASERGVNVAAYCLMPNHYHLLLRQAPGGDIGKVMTSLGIGYVKYYNYTYGQVGRLFQDRYRARYVRDGADLLNVSAYIHWNPADLIDPVLYEWSSYSAYLGAVNRFCTAQLVLTETNQTPASYAIYCRSRKNPEVKVGQGI